MRPREDAVGASPVYANFQPPVCTARMSPYAWWALAPPSHPYRHSLKPDVHYETIFKYGGGYFLLHVQALADFYLLGSGVPCVARTFLSLFSEGDRPAASRPTVFWPQSYGKSFRFRVSGLRFLMFQVQKFRDFCSSCHFCGRGESFDKRNVKMSVLSFNRR